MGFIAFVKDCFATLCDALGPKGTNPRPCKGPEIKGEGVNELARALAEQRQTQMERLLYVTLRDNLIKEAERTPFVTVDGKPNPKWVDKFGLAFPSLSEARIRAKLEELITDEEYIIEEFLGGPAHHMPNWEAEIDPELRTEHGDVFVRVNNMWHPVAGARV